MKWKRAELKTMNLLTDGTSRAAVSGSSRSLTGTWQGREEEDDECGWGFGRSVKLPACDVCLHWPGIRCSPACCDTETGRRWGSEASCSASPGRTDLRSAERAVRPQAIIAHSTSVTLSTLMFAFHGSVLQAKRWHLDWGVTVEEDTGSQTHCHAYAFV